MHKFVQHEIETPAKSGKSSTYAVSAESQLANQDCKPGLYAFKIKNYMNDVCLFIIIVEKYVFKFMCYYFYNLCTSLQIKYFV